MMDIQNATIHSLPGLNGSRIPYAQMVEDGSIVHLHHLCKWEEGEVVPVTFITRDHESPLRAVVVNEAITTVLNDDQTAFVEIPNADLLQSKLEKGEWKII